MNRHASMNRIFRLVWNESLNAYVPAAETTRGRGKRSKRKLVSASCEVTVSDSVSGADAGDYTLVEPTGLVGNITPVSLTVSGTTLGSGSTTARPQTRSRAAS